MSEEILKALMQLFGLIAKQDGGVESNETEFVRTFLKMQLDTEAVEAYFDLFLHHAEADKTSDDGKVQLTSMRDSVKILGICKKINKQLNREQKVVVLVRLYELVSADQKFTDQRMAIINTVAEVFKLDKAEVEAIEAFNVNTDSAKVDYPDILVVNDKESKFSQALHIQVPKLDNAIHILRVKSANLYFLRYLGSQDLYLNGLLLSPERIYIFPKGSFIKLPQGKPIYYTDVVANFMKDGDDSPISFEVKNVSYKFKNGTLGLRNINLAEQQGKLIGIMGASGAGKTTLLNVLCGNESPTEGEVLINGINLHTNKEALEGVIGLIPQDDLLIEELTVYQNLYYNAKLCFRDKNEKQIDEMVCATLKSLGLYERKDLTVGSPLNKMISGGQRKRLNIALELIREPGVLFVDEPTSGLSSRDSENVMNLLRELALKGKLIFVVIHQPSSDIYKMFDKMFILDTGGYPVYYGNPSESLIYFKTLDSQVNSEVGECPTCGNLNPELIFNILDANVIDEYGNYTNQRKVKPEEWNEFYKEKITIPKVETVQTPPPRSLNIPSWFKQFRIYTTRDFWAKISNTQYILLNILEAPLLGFVLAYLIRYIVDPDSDVYIFRENENVPIYVFMAIIVALFFGLIVSAEEIFKDAKILKREAFLNLSRSAYLMSKVLILMGLSAIQMLLFIVVGNFVIGFKGMTPEFWFTLFSVSVSANILGLIISSTFNSIVTIYIMIPLLMIPQMVLGGAMFTFDKLNKDFTSIDKVPFVAEFIPTRYAYEGLIVYQYRHNKFKKGMFDMEMKESRADFKQVYYLPELNNVLDHCIDKYKAKSIDATYVSDLALLKNELGNEMRRNPTIEFGMLNSLKQDAFDYDVYEAAKSYLRRLEEVYKDEFYQANGQRERTISHLLATNEKKFNRFKDEYYNERVSEIVHKTFDKNKILRDGNKLIQIIDPIYQLPEPTSAFSFRTHFFAPKKYFAGFYWDTLWFNVASIWVLTIFMYFVLYYDLVRKIFEYLGEIKLVKKLPSFKKK